MNVAPWHVSLEYQARDVHANAKTVSWSKTILLLPGEVLIQAITEVDL